MVARRVLDILYIIALELRDSFGAYDATYVALAELLGARLMTADQGLARAVREAGLLTVVEA